MSNDPTLDQLRLFVAVADHGSLSAAARALGRAQSAVSYGIAQLETRLEVPLFQRQGRGTRLSPQGRRLLEDARAVLSEVGRMRSRAAELRGQHELCVRLAVDAICPVTWIAALGAAFDRIYPKVQLELHTDVLGGIADAVRRGRADLGICGPLLGPVRSLDAIFLFELPMVAVAAPGHPLARIARPLAQADLIHRRQIVVGRRGPDDPDGDQAVFSGTTWRVQDVATKRALIRLGLGWGHLPLPEVADDLAAGRLVRLELSAWGDRPLAVPLHRIVRRDAPLGPAARALARLLEDPALRPPARGPQVHRRHAPPTDPRSRP